MTEKQRPYLFLAEIVLIALALAGLNQVLQPANPGFIAVSPHPYWLLVLLMASRYGVVQGFVAGAVASGLYLYFGLSSEQLDVSGVSFPHGDYLLPFLFMFTGGLVGQIRSFYKNRHQQLEKKYTSLFDRFAELKKLYETLLESKKMLERRIATQTHTLLTLFEQLMHIGQEDETEKLTGKLLALLQEQLDVECASVYRLQSNTLKRQQSLCSNSESRLGEELDLRHGLIGEVIAQKQLVCINHIYDKSSEQEYAQENIIMAAPILLEDGSIFGVVVIEKMPFLRYNANSVRIFDKMVQWFATVLISHKKYQQAREGTIADEITGAFNYAYFEKRLRYEITRAKRYQTELGLALIRVTEFYAMSEQNRTDLLVILNMIFRHSLPETALIAKYKAIDTFAIIFPHEDIDKLKEIMKTLKREIENFHFRPFEDQDRELDIRVGLAFLEQAGGTFEQLTRSAEAALENSSALDKRSFSDLHFLDDVQQAFRDLEFLRKN
ncbi:MAG TPA: diguanylate cyclase [Bacteroidetes bacterium]|nr:diguanylate cyclase [Bacteroidota bacterium]